MKQQTIPQKILWIDLEMTGLEPSNQRIIEVAALVTDSDLREIEQYEAVIHQPETVLQQAEEWPREHMQELFKEVRASQRSEDDVRNDLVELIGRHFGEEKAVLAGNSIHQDRRFIRRWWPEIDALLHYRMLDVSSFKIVLQMQGGQEFEKLDKHRALDDIRESIAELAWSLQTLSSSHDK